MSKLDELKIEAAELGVQFSPNIGEAKLQSKIDEFYDAKETDSAELQKLVKEKEKEEAIVDKPVVSNKLNATKVLAKERERNARKTRVVTIIDNDQRINNQSTSCTVNCSNMYFDLGTAILPLGVKVEVAVGHINSLKQVKIPHHVKDIKTGLSTVALRERYSISYEDMKA